MKVLVIGETCCDVTVHCSVTRLCPEGPVPVANPVHATESLGMAANVYANLRSLGCGEARLLSQTSDIVKTRYVDEVSGYLLLRVDEHDKADPIDATQLEQTLKEDWAAIVISSYDKGFLSEDDIAFIGATARQRRIPTFLDTKRVLGPFSRDITFVKINRREYDLNVKAIGRPAEHCQNLIVTLGAQGSWWVNGDQTVSVDPVVVSDVTGAGDTALAALALAYLTSGGNVLKAMDYANRAARIAVSRRGVVAVKQEEVE